MLVEEEDLQLLRNIGLTQNQAKLYLTLINIGKANAKTLAEHSNVPRQAIYRTIAELEEKGLVERIIAAPYEFVATPIRNGLQILLNQKSQEHEETVKKTELLVARLDQSRGKNGIESEHRIVMIKGKDKFFQLVKKQHDKAQFNVEFISSAHMWLKIVEECHENYEKALERGVHYRGILEVPEGKISLPKSVLAFMSKPNFDLKLVQHSKANFVIFDEKEAYFNFLLTEQHIDFPIIWTNHPSLLVMCKEHFDKNWKTAKKFR